MQNLYAYNMCFGIYLCLRRAIDGAEAILEKVFAKAHF